jgi:hypothetical protein
MHFLDILPPREFWRLLSATRAAYCACPRPSWHMVRVLKQYEHHINFIEVLPPRVFWRPLNATCYSHLHRCVRGQPSATAHAQDQVTYGEGIKICPRIHAIQTIDNTCVRGQLSTTAHAQDQVTYCEGIKICPRIHANSNNWIKIVNAS